MTSYVDRNYFAELKKASAAEICRNNRCSYNPSSMCYTISIWGEIYTIDCANAKISRNSSSSPPPHEFFYLFIIYYLLLPQDIRQVGEWISEKDFPGGATFFRGPHLLPTDRISSRFGNDIDGFREYCQSLGGTPLPLADAAFSFAITGDITIAVLYWTGDDDFPAEAKILYDKANIKALPLDIVFALAYEVCQRLGAPGSDNPRQGQTL
ncbi:MAG: DUF3786 domain-containing protein [Desulforhopalus sp.]|nr:DUF3786 domain-containing protein [Desulforhopalus sp.]